MTTPCIVVENMSEPKRRKELVETPEDIGIILSTVSDQLPKMIKGILNSFFNPEAATNMALAVANFRKTLIENGIPEDQARAMTREYMGTVTNLSGVMREAHRSRHYEE